MKTQKQFIAQFPVEVTNWEQLQKQGLLIRTPESDFAGVEVWRALNLLFIRHNGKFYMRSA